MLLSTTISAELRHWEFGYHLRDYQPGDDRYVNKFIEKVGKKPFGFYFSLIIISIADILGSQPFGMNNLTVEMNHKSKFLPFIRNVPKKYSGGNVADLNAESREKFAEAILDKVKVMYG